MGGPSRPHGGRPVRRSGGLPAWHLDVDGCTNFRDAGGWNLVEGGQMRTGVLYRSDGPQRVSDRGRSTVAGLDLELVVDLRQYAYFIRTPGFVPPDLTAHIPLVDRVIDVEDPPPLARPEDFVELYEGMLDASREPLARALDLIAQRIVDGPVLVHCSFGKDRAGLVVAIIQAAIGVEVESIVADYGRSDEPARSRHQWMTDDPWPGDADLGTVPTDLFRAHPETMSMLLDRTIDRHGSLDAWVASFPIRADTVTRLRRALVDIE